MDIDDEKCPADMAAAEEEKEWQGFKAKLIDFPHSFHLENEQRQIDASYLKKQIKSLQSGLKVGYKTDLETARAKNYLAFVLFWKGERSEALLMIDEVLSMEEGRHNLVSLANKAAMLWQTERRPEAEKVISQLLQVKTNAADFEYLRVKAKAELAFSYTRMRPKFFPKAVTAFEEVLAQAQEPEIWLWTFGLALTKRRMLHVQHMPMLETKNVRKEAANTLQMFLGIIRHSNSKCLQAKTYAEIATLMANANFDRQLQQDLQQSAQMNPIQASNLALELDGSDTSVLCKTAKIFLLEKQLESSADVLKKALSMRPTSTAYHYLAMVYQELAIKTKEERVSGNPFGTAPAAETEHDMLKIFLKCPLASTVKLSKEDPFVNEAMEYFEEAIKYSKGTNLVAKYDFAVMHRFVGELDIALQLLQEIQQSRWENTSYLAVNSFEQAGLILREQSDAETDKQRKKELSLQAEHMLYRALTKAVKLYSRNPHFEGHIGEIWNSFSELLKEVDGSDLTLEQKLGGKAKLFQMISDPRTSLALLDEIRNMTSEDERPEHLKMRIENYVALQEFDKAIAFIELLRCMSQGSTTLRLFEVKQCVLNVYFQAARLALQKNSLADSREQFHNTFMEAVEHDQVDTTSASDTDCEENLETWDVMLIYDRYDTSQDDEKANALAGIFRDVCGLKVTMMDDDVTLGKLSLRGMLSIMKRSHIVAVLAGHKRVSGELKTLINHAAQRHESTTITLLVNGDHVPQILKIYPWMPCPAELFSPAIGHTAVISEHVTISTEQTEGVAGCIEQLAVREEQAAVSTVKSTSDTEQTASYSEQTVKAICSVFAFLVGIDKKQT